MTTIRLCSVDRCEPSHCEHGLCYTPYIRRAQRQGRPANQPLKPVGYQFLNRDGYVQIKTTSGYKSQHRFVMEQRLGRPLHAHENIHHINGQRDDNRIDNLELWSKSQPAGQRVADKVAWAIEFLSEYGYTVDGPHRWN